MRKIVHYVLTIMTATMAIPSFSMADTSVTGSITVGEEYNDNVNDTAKKKGDFISTVSPTLNFAYTGSRVRANIDYSGTLRIYDTGQRTNETLNNLAATASADVVENLLVIDASDTNSMVFSNATQGTPNSSDSTRNQVNQNAYSAGATLTPHLNDRTTLGMGYRFTGTAYTSGDGINKYDQMGFLNLLYELTPKLEIGANANVDRQTADQGSSNNFAGLTGNNPGTVTRYTATGLARYTYGEGCNIFIQGGAMDSVYDIGGSDLLPTWSAGWNHLFGKTGISLLTSGGYVNNPNTIYNSFQSTYSATVYHEFSRARVAATASYNDYTGKDTGHSKDVSAYLNLTYDVTPRLGASVSLGLVNTISSSNSFAARNSNLDSGERLYGSVQLSYALPKDFSAQMYYRNKTSLAGNGSSNSNNNYNSNIVGISLTKTF